MSKGKPKGSADIFAKAMRRAHADVTQASNNKPDPMRRDLSQPDNKVDAEVRR